MANPRKSLRTWLAARAFILWGAALGACWTLMNVWGFWAAWHAGQNVAAVGFSMSLGLFLLCLPWSLLVWALMGVMSRVPSAMVGAFVTTRFLVMAATHAGVARMTAQESAEWAWWPDRDLRFAGAPPPGFLAPTIRWDSNFYISLARAGYPPRPPGPGPNHHLASFPLYPLLVRATAGVPADVLCSCGAGAACAAVWASLASAC